MMPRIDDPPAIAPGERAAQHAARIAALQAHHGRLCPAETIAGQARPVVVNGAVYASVLDAVEQTGIRQREIYEALQRGQVRGVVARWA